MIRSLCLILARRVDEAEEDFGKLDLPVEEAAVGTLSPGLDLGNRLLAPLVLQARRRSLPDRSGPGDCPLPPVALASGRPKWSARKVEDDLVSGEHWRAWSYRLTESATSAAVASAILLTNRTMLDGPQERLVVEAEEPSAGGRLQILERRPDQRVAAAQVMVEEVERRAQREGVEPQADLGQLDGHRVEIDAVDAALEDVPLEQVDVGQLVADRR